MAPSPPEQEAVVEGTTEASEAQAMTPPPEQEAVVEGTTEASEAQAMTPPPEQQAVVEGTGASETPSTIAPAEEGAAASGEQKNDETALETSSSETNSTNLEINKIDKYAEEVLKNYERFKAFKNEIEKSDVEKSDVEKSDVEKNEIASSPGTVEEQKTIIGGSRKNMLKRKKTHYKKFNSKTSLKRKHKTIKLLIKY
jgi:hypothetical protein